MTIYEAHSMLKISNQRCHWARWGKQAIFWLYISISRKWYEIRPRLLL